MKLWIFFLFLVGATSGILMAPLMRRTATQDAAAHPDIKIYGDQLAEIDRDVERGLLSADQAETSRNEIRRRILAVGDSAHTVSNSGFMRWAAILLIVLLMPIGSVTLYNMLGSPELPDQPYAQRAKNDPYFVLMSNIVKEVEKVKAHPSAQGYKHIGDIYFNLQRYGPAAEAFAKASELDPKSSVLWSSLGESLILMNDGVVVPAATNAFANAFRIDPHNARAEFYLGAAALETRGTRAALAIWRDLEEKSPQAAPWMPMLKQYIQTYSARDKIDPETVAPVPPDANDP